MFIFKRFERQMHEKPFGVSKPENLNTIAKISYGYLHMNEIDHIFFKDKLHHLGTEHFKDKYI